MERPGALATKRVRVRVMKRSEESAGPTLADWEQAASGDDDYV